MSSNSETVALRAELDTLIALMVAGRVADRGAMAVRARNLDLRIRSLENAEASAMKKPIRIPPALKDVADAAHAIHLMASDVGFVRAFGGRDKLLDMLAVTVANLAAMVGPPEHLEEAD